jgi:hypothetical protein
MIVFSPQPEFSPTFNHRLPTKTASTPNRGHFPVTLFLPGRLISVFKNKE